MYSLTNFQICHTVLITIDTVLYGKPQISQLKMRLARFASHPIYKKIIMHNETVKTLAKKHVIYKRVSFFPLNVVLSSSLTCFATLLVPWRFLLLTMYHQFCTSLFTYRGLFFPSIFIVNCLHNPWVYINLSLNVFHLPLVSFNSIDLPYLIFLHYSKIHLAAVQHSYFFFSPFGRPSVLLTNLTRLWELLHRGSPTHTLESYRMDHASLAKDWCLSSSLFYRVHNLVILCPACKPTVAHDLFISCHLFQRTKIIWNG